MAIGIATPDRVEGADLATGGIPNGTAAESKSPGLEYFHSLGAPGKRSGTALKEWVPACQDGRPPVQSTLATKEDSVHSYVGRERLGIAGGESLGKGPLGGENLLSQGRRVGRLSLGNGREEEGECEEYGVPEAHQTFREER